MKKSAKKKLILIKLSMHIYLCRCVWEREKLTYSLSIYICGCLVVGKRLDILTLDGLGCPPLPQDPELLLSSTSRDKRKIL